jgi:hypothetical protein
MDNNHIYLSISVFVIFIILFFVFRQENFINSSSLPVSYMMSSNNVTPKFVPSNVVNQPCPNGYSMINGFCFSDVVTNPILTCPSPLNVYYNGCVGIADANCPSGFTMHNNMCVQTINPVTPTCPTGYSIRDNKCITSSITNATQTCNDGSILHNGKCMTLYNQIKSQQPK